MTDPPPDRRVADRRTADHGPDRRTAIEGPDADLVLALSPRQILGGFALIAALVMLLRRKSRGDRDRDAGRD